jgi:hypothetical protein
MACKFLSFLTLYLFLLLDKHYKKQLSVADDLSGLFDRPTPNVSTNQVAPSITLPQVNKPKPLLHWCHTEQPWMRG